MTLGVWTKRVGIPGPQGVQRLDSRSPRAFLGPLTWRIKQSGELMAYRAEDNADAAGRLFAFGCNIDGTIGSVNAAQAWEGRSERSTPTSSRLTSSLQRSLRRSCADFRALPSGARVFVFEQPAVLYYAVKPVALKILLLMRMAMPPAFARRCIMRSASCCHRRCRRVSSPRRRVRGQMTAKPNYSDRQLSQANY